MQQTINCKGRLLDLSSPLVMGILNVTPDSFYDGGQHTHVDTALKQAEKMIEEGAKIIDIGGMSSRPGSETISEEEELRRVMPVLEAIVRDFPDAFISIDTVHARVAKAAIHAGGHIVNDISAGTIDPALIPTVAALGVPYILMHMQGKPKDMQQKADYEDIVTDLLDFFIQKVAELRQAGIRDIILDPGFGFGKTIEHNYKLLKNLQTLQILGLPLLAGISRKSMIYKLLETSPDQALNGTSTLHITALQNGARLLRVHDVKEAVEVIRLWKMLDSV